MGVPDGSGEFSEIPKSPNSPKATASAARHRIIFVLGVMQRNHPDDGIAPAATSQGELPILALVEDRGVTPFQW
jgi:hypothetical protein